jgi:hypothetical protein
LAVCKRCVGTGLGPTLGACQFCNGVGSTEGVEADVSPATPETPTGDHGKVPVVREVLPQRSERESEIVEHIWSPNASGQMSEFFLLSIGRYEDGRPGEVFINYEGKPAERSVNVGHDIATLISIALQYGAPVEVLRDAMGHSVVNFMGTDRVMAHTVVGTVLQVLAGGPAQIKEDPFK